MVCILFANRDRPTTQNKMRRSDVTKVMNGSPMLIGPSGLWVGWNSVLNIHGIDRKCAPTSFRKVSEAAIGGSFVTPAFRLHFAFA